MSDIKNYIPGLARGANLTGGDVSIQNFYATFTAETNGQVAVNVLGTNLTAPTAGTITGFYVAQQSATAGTFSLWATTAGTIALIPTIGTYVGLGVMMGTSILNAAVASGDTIQVSSITNSGTAACFVIFQTQN